MTPLEPAGPESVTVPVTLFVPLPAIEDAESDKLESVGAVTVRVAVFETPLVAVRVTEALAFTA